MQYLVFADSADTGEGRARRRCAVLLTPGFSPGKGIWKIAPRSGRRQHQQFLMKFANKSTGGGMDKK